MCLSWTRAMPEIVTRQGEWRNISRRELQKYFQALPQEKQKMVRLGVTRMEQLGSLRIPVTPVFFTGDITQVERLRLQFHQHFLRAGG